MKSGLSSILVIGCFAIMPIATRSQAPQPLRVAIVGLEHGHVEGFLAQLPRHTDVQLVGIADADPSLFAKYQKKYSLPETLFFKSTANMIETRHPQAVLVYTSIARAPPCHRDCRPVRRLRHGRKTADHLARRRPRHSQKRPPTPHPGAGQLRNHLVCEQPRSPTTK